MDIDFGSFEIKLNVGRNQKIINYQCDPETSIAIKNTLSELASAKGIKVKEG
jgi:hypothetical protein